MVEIGDLTPQKFMYFRGKGITRPTTTTSTRSRKRCHCRRTRKLPPALGGHEDEIWYYARRDKGNAMVVAIICLQFYKRFTVGSVTFVTAVTTRARCGAGEGWNPGIRF